MSEIAEISQRFRFCQRHSFARYKMTHKDLVDIRDVNFLWFKIVSYVINVFGKIDRS